MSKKETRSGGELSTIIGADAVLEGDLTVKNSARIDGRLKGCLRSSNTVTIGPEGNIEGDISAAIINVGGKIIGNLVGKERVVLEANAILTGNLKTVRLVIEEGAVFNGASEMGDGKSLPSTHTPRKIVLDREEERVEE